jgi:triosephosphate isomerase (TIM)
MTAQRRRVFAGNWKMYKNRGETRAFFAAFNPLVANVGDCDIIIAPPFTDISAAVDSTLGTRIAISAQDVFWENEGAFTGEISALMLVEAGCRYTIIGHSERRQYFGETLADREANRTKHICDKQFHGGVGALTPEEFSRILLAYEPVWAIGTGRVATPEMAAEAHKFIRQFAAVKFSASLASALRILYGGSVKPDNIQGLMAQEELDGALVGGASLDAKSFAAIVTSWPR